MNYKRVVFSLGLVVLSAISIITVVGSCKKQSVQDKPETFDASIDGVGIRSLPEMDIELAERIVRDGPVSPVDDVTDESILAAGASEPAGLPGGGVGTAGATLGDTLFDETAGTDPNAF